MTPSPLSVVIHGHFYQPPREDPWLETLERQASAAPYHDWNERIAQECYRAVLAARVPGAGGRIARIVNTLHFISFNFGPTLLEWMEANVPLTYRSILEADAVSLKLSGGHGNALAQAYHHTILPLASRREKVSEVRWGIQDFRRRFGRDPAGMWLPETAIDRETLEVLAQEGIAFTIVAPHQVTKTPARGLPGVFRTSGGRSIALFVYDGSLSHGVAFGPYLKDAEAWVAAIVGLHHWEGDSQSPGEASDAGSRGGGPGPEGDGPGPEGGGLGPGSGSLWGKHPDPERAGRPQLRRLVSMATDGETYGHHHRFGEMALAAVLLRLQSMEGVQLENFASFLAHTPPRVEVELVEPSSWSCSHGVGRWRTDCGCRSDTTRPSQQEWRTWLREAVDWLAGEIHEIYVEEGTSLLGDPWTARDRFGTVASSEPEASQSLLGQIAPRELDALEMVRARELLELERQALRLFTSCGWFFDDLAGLEPLQVLRYAARALELSGARRAELEEGFLKRLEKATSNEMPMRSGREIFLQDAKPRMPAPIRVAAGMAVWEMVQSERGEEGKSTEPGVAEMSPGKPVRAGPGVPGFSAVNIGRGRFRITHRRTGRQWVVEAKARWPALGRVEVKARPQEEESEFRPWPGRRCRRVFGIPSRSLCSKPSSPDGFPGRPGKGWRTVPGTSARSWRRLSQRPSGPWVGRRRRTRPPSLPHLPSPRTPGLTGSGTWQIFTAFWIFPYLSTHRPSSTASWRRPRPVRRLGCPSFVNL
jgi:alpha-amylase/alpha-mannosidase (GH57 family)